MWNVYDYMRLLLCSRAHMCDIVSVAMAQTFEDLL
jgi:hypothetical protein